MQKDRLLASILVIRDTLLALIEANQNFKNSALNDQLPSWVMKTATRERARKKGVKLSTQLTYQKTQAKQETVKCTGIIGISKKTYNLGLELNRRKDNFKKSMYEYRSFFGQSFQMKLQSSQELRETLLKKLNLSHLHFVQAYRHIKIFPSCPRKIGFSWSKAHTSSVHGTPRQTIEYLKNKFALGPGIKKDIEFLESLSKNEKIFIKRTLQPHLRANITWSMHIEAQKKLNKSIKILYPSQINTPLPIFITMKKNDLLPEFNQIQPLDQQNKQERLIRKDTVLQKIRPHQSSVLFKVKSTKKTTTKKSTTKKPIIKKSTTKKSTRKN